MTVQYGYNHVRQREVLQLVATLKEWSADGVAIESVAGGRKSRPGRDGRIENDYISSEIMISHGQKRCENIDQQHTICRYCETAEYIPQSRAQFLRSIYSRILEVVSSLQSCETNISVSSSYF
jgi:hypothetical protein